MMSPNKMVVTLLMVSVQIASAAEESPVGYVESFKNFCGGIVSSSRNVAGNCAETFCANKKAVAALVVVSGVSAAAYYNWDRVKQAYNKAVVSVKANQEAIVKTLKVGAVAASVIGAVTLAAYKIHEYCFAAVEEVASNVEGVENVTTDNEVKEEAPVTDEVVILPAEAVEVVASDVEGAGLEDSFVASTPVVAESSDRFDSNLVANLV